VTKAKKCVDLWDRCVGQSDGIRVEVASEAVMGVTGMMLSVSLVEVVAEASLLRRGYFHDVTATAAGR